MGNAAPATSLQHQQPHPAGEAATADASTHAPGIMGPFPQAPQVFSLLGHQAILLAPLGRGNELHFALPPDTDVFLNEKSCETTWDVQDTAIIVEFNDSSRITITNFLNPPNNKFPTLILQDGETASGADIVHALEWADIPIGN
ncbi:hypothetical protein [Desulfovibrio cuneatus]|uniref:hypothetical protein n=1 Tax=Desulfovibrio cuneatus TaxID=159728 RepID=UPI0003FF3C42|nr:hypothetical protein [Desulfovibrio cuneatus]